MKEHLYRSLQTAIAALVVLCVAVVVTQERASALPPLTFSELERIYVGEDFRDGGRIRVLACTTGDFSDAGSNAEEIWNFFAGRLPDYQIAGMIGNMTVESAGLNPQRLETVFDRSVPAEQLFEEAPDAFATFSAAEQSRRGNDSTNIGWGIVQWTPYTKITTWVDRISDANLLSNQLAFLWEQLNGLHDPRDARAGTDFMNVPREQDPDDPNGPFGVEGATRVFAEEYERPSAAALARSFAERLQAANGAMARFGHIATVDSPVTDGELGGNNISSCADSTDGNGSVAAIAEEQLLTGGATFMRDVPDGGPADFVSWAFRQAGSPYTGGTGDGGWRYSSPSALQDFYVNDPTGQHRYFEVGAETPIPGDVAFYVNNEGRIVYVDIVVEVNGDRITVIGADANGNVSRSTRTPPYEQGGLRLIGFGRAASQVPPGEDNPNAGNNGSVVGLDNPLGFTHDCNGLDTTQMSSAAIAGLANGKYGAFHSDCFTRVVPANEADQGEHPEGQFRLICNVSHFSYDDPIIFPNQPGAAHLHMFWGNTGADAFTNFNPADRANNLMESGGSTCQGGALNRSAYWAPAMLKGHGNDTQVVLPKVITLYYKSKRPWEVQPLPQGIQLLVGNVNNGGSVNSSFTKRESLHWGCYNPAIGIAVNQTSTIPGATNGSPDCPNGWDIQASIQFPQCIQMAGGRPVLTHSDFKSHTAILEQNGFGRQDLACTDLHPNHPYRVPQISYLIRWDNPGAGNVRDWRLSSDAGFDQPTVQFPGGSLHGDWLGGWQDQTIQAWIDGCFRTSTGPGAPGRNCSLGQTGQNGTNRTFRNLGDNSTKIDGFMTYRSYSPPNHPQYLPLVTTGGSSGGGSGGVGSGEGTSIPAPSGTRYYVGPGGSGVSTNRSSPGSQSATIARVCDGSGSQIKGGDQIIFLDGSYDSMRFDNKNCGNGQYIYLSSQNPRGAKILRGGGVIFDSSSYFVIEGFERRGINSQSVPFEYGIVARNRGTGGQVAHHIVIRNNLVHNVASCGICTVTATHLIIEDNEVHSTSNWDPYQASGISHFGHKNPSGFGPIVGIYSNTIRNNLVYNNFIKQGDPRITPPPEGRITDGNCIIIDVNNQGGEYFPRTLIANNVCMNNARGINILSSSHVDVFNNTLYNNRKFVYGQTEILMLCEDRGFKAHDVNFFNNIVVPSGNILHVNHTDSSWMSPDQCDMRNIQYKNNVLVGQLRTEIDPFKQPVFPQSTSVNNLGNCNDNWVNVSLSDVGFVSPGLTAQADFSLSPSSALRGRGCGSSPVNNAYSGGVDYIGAIP